MTTRLVAFIGYKGCGKSLAQSFLQEQGYKHFAFAEPLKKMLETLGLTKEELYGSKKEVPSGLLLGTTPRHAMQTLGTEWGRNCINEELWTNILYQNVKEHLSASIKNKAVVDDLRFLNEYSYLKRLDCNVVHILRDGCEETGHASEQDVKLIPHTHQIWNCGTSDELKEKIYQLLELEKAA